MTAGGGVEPVAVVGPVWMLAWAGSGPIEPIVRSHGLKIGDGLYTLTQVRQVAELIAADKEYDEARQQWEQRSISGTHDFDEAEYRRMAARLESATARRASALAALGEST